MFSRGWELNGEEQQCVVVGALPSLSSHTITVLCLYPEIQNSDYRMSFAAMGCELKNGLLKYNGLLKCKSKGSEMTSGE